MGEGKDTKNLDEGEMNQEKATVNVSHIDLMVGKKPVGSSSSLEQIWIVGPSSEPKKNK